MWRWKWHKVSVAHKINYRASDRRQKDHYKKYHALSLRKHTHKHWKKRQPPLLSFLGTFQLLHPLPSFNYWCKDHSWGGCVASTGLERGGSWDFACILPCSMYFCNDLVIYSPITDRCSREKEKWRKTQLNSRHIISQAHILVSYSALF